MITRLDGMIKAGPGALELYLFDASTGLWETNQHVIMDTIERTYGFLDACRLRLNAKGRVIGFDYVMQFENSRSNVYKLLRSHVYARDPGWHQRASRARSGRVLFLNG
jgi:hypothetical protein